MAMARLARCHTAMAEPLQGSRPCSEGSRPVNPEPFDEMAEQLEGSRVNAEPVDEMADAVEASRSVSLEPFDEMAEPAVENSRPCSQGSRSVSSEPEHEPKHEMAEAEEGSRSVSPEPLDEMAEAQFRALG